MLMKKMLVTRTWAVSAKLMTSTPIKIVSRASATAPRSERDEPDDGGNRARLAGAVGAEKGDDLALLDPKRCLLNRPDRAVADREALD